MARRPMKPMVEALATDHVLYARFVDIWREGSEEPVKINDIAWELSIGQAKAAITMKAAEAQGWVRRVGPRTEQYAYEPTAKALEQWPASGQSVMPSNTVVENGVRITSESADEARRWGPGNGDVELMAPNGPERYPGLVPGTDAFEGYDAPDPED